MYVLTNSHFHAHPHGNQTEEANRPEKVDMSFCRLRMVLLILSVFMQQMHFIASYSIPSGRSHTDLLFTNEDCGGLMPVVQSFRFSRAKLDREKFSFTVTFLSQAVLRKIERPATVNARRTDNLKNGSLPRKIDEYLWLV